MADTPSIEAALRNAANLSAGVAPNPDDMYLATYGAPRPQANLATTIGYDDYMQRINNANLPAFRRSGAYYAPDGGREAYENYNIPPVLRQVSPYATAAYRTFVDPFGQMMVQPLVGFPSAYPHVLSGVPTNPLYGFGMATQLGGMMPPMPMGMPWGVGQSPLPAATRRVGGSQAVGMRNTAPKKTPVGQHWVHPESDPNANVGNYVLVPNDDSQARLHPQYEGQLRVSANYPDPARPVPRVGPTPVTAPPEIAYPWMHYMNPAFTQSAAPAPVSDPGRLGAEAAYYEATPPSVPRPGVTGPNEPNAAPYGEEWSYHLLSPTPPAPDAGQLSRQEDYYTNTPPPVTAPILPVIPPPVREWLPPESPYRVPPVAQLPSSLAR